MIRRLRLNVVLVSMLSLLIVLTIILGTVNILFYRGVVQDAESVLQLLSANHGTFMKVEQTIDWEHAGSRPHSPELPFESRYFSVLLTPEGSILQSDTGKITAIDSETADTYALSIFNSGKKQGWIESYRYETFNEDSNLRIIFLDCRKQLDSLTRMIKLCLGASFTGLIAVLALLILFSGYIIKPFIENYEKQKRFITDAGHELKTPITIIKADTEVLKDDIEDAELKEWLDDIDTQTNRLSGLIQELILLARMDEGEKTEQNILNFTKIVEEEAESFTKMAKAAEKTLNLAIEPELNIRGEEKNLHRLISILLDNALKYSTEKDKIEVTLCKKGRTILLSTENTSENLNPEIVCHMFERFYRGDSSHSNSIRGYGMGLSIAEAIVQQHNGKIHSILLEENRLKITAEFPAITK